MSDVQSDRSRPVNKPIRVKTGIVMVLFAAHVAVLLRWNFPWWSHLLAAVCYIGFIMWLIRRRLRYSKKYRLEYRAEEFVPFAGQWGKSLTKEGAAATVVQQLYENEYNKAVERYQNIYTAVWQNFSYMAILAAGILTFGKGQVDIAPLIAIAIAPLLFWYVATFVPLDHYGQQNGEYLKKMERALHGEQAGHFVGFRQADPPWHVNEAVHRFAILVGMCFATAFLTSVDNLSSVLPREEENAVVIRLSKAQVEVAPISQLDSIGRRLSSIESVILRDSTRRTQDTTGKTRTTTQRR
ncbi:hypothetical protein SAMN05216486_10846 [bacterium JGI 053]|nr:hypothetical protein SAMN05216486_10846 [bacterium JGI 053]